MWTLTTTNIGEGVVSATATHDSGFSWNAIIKVGDLGFADTAKAELAKHQEKHKDDDIFEAELLTALNK